MNLFKTKNKKITEIFKKHPVLFAYVFGSFAKNKVLPFSDLDIAVYVNPVAKRDERNKIISDIREELEKKLKMPQKIDLICLNNELPPMLLRNIIYEGKLVYSKDEQKRINWESRAMSLWWDWEYYQRQFDEAILSISRI